MTPSLPAEITDRLASLIENFSRDDPPKGPDGVNDAAPELVISDTAREKLAALDSTSPLPWDFISQTTSPDYLMHEYRKYLSASTAGIAPASQK